MDELTLPQPASPTSPTTRRGPHRASRILLGAIATTAVVVAGSGLAGAAVVDDNDANLAVTPECVEGEGPRLTLLYTNPEGPAVAHFTTTVDGKALDPVSVAPGGQTVVHVPAPEGSKPVVMVSANGGYAEMITPPQFNCWDMQKHLDLQCREDGPVMVVTGTNTGQLSDQLTILHNEVPWGVFDLAAGETFTYTVHLTEDASYEVRAVPSRSGWSSSTGYADCVKPTAVPDPEPEPESEPELEELPAPEPSTETSTTTTTPPAVVQGVAVSAVATEVSVSPRFTG